MLRQPKANFAFAKSELLHKCNTNAYFLGLGKLWASWNVLMTAPPEAAASLTASGYEIKPPEGGCFSLL